MLRNFFVYYKNGFGFTKSYRYAFGVTVKDTVLYYGYWALVLTMIGFVLGLGIQKLEAKEQIALARQAAYTKALEGVVGNCVSDNTGKPIQIGDDWYLCGITHIGRFSK